MCVTTHEPAIGNAFYFKLVWRHGLAGLLISCWRQCSSFTCDKIPSSIGQCRPITLDEVSEAMKQLPSGKAPGVDSIPAEFYQELWDNIDRDVFNFVTEAITQATLADELNISKITLLPKSEDRLRIKNYRPISLLNTLYKVVAKVYANRMKPILHHWILPSQTGFVPNRCILDNISLAFESIEWAGEPASSKHDPSRFWKGIR